jgi:hypothetical protein
MANEWRRRADRSRREDFEINCCARDVPPPTMSDRDHALVDQTQTSDGQGTSTLATRNMFATVGEVDWGLGGGGWCRRERAVEGDACRCQSNKKKSCSVLTSDALLHDVG